MRRGAGVRAARDARLRGDDWGTFKLTDEPTGEPPEKLLAWWRERGLPDERLWLMDVGETRALSAASRDHRRARAAARVQDRMGV